MVVKSKSANKKSAGESAASRTKKEAIIAMLHRKNGACVNDLTKATGWQAHSVRGFLSGTVKRKLGLNLITERQVSGVLRYFIRSGK